MDLSHLEWGNIITIVGSVVGSMGIISGGLYRLIHKDIESLKEDHKAFKEELKEYRKKSHLMDMRLDGLYNVLIGRKDDKNL